MTVRQRISRPVARPSPPSEAQIDALLALVLDLPARKPAAGQPRRLSGLFRELGRPDPPRGPDMIEDLIWAHWISHREPLACAAMAHAIEALGAGALDLARPILDDLVTRYPRWSEAWNKRSILGFIEKRNADALADIERTLVLEPRHFGAVSGFGQICLRLNRPAEARAAFQVALSLNPHLEGVREAVGELGAALSPAFLH